MPTSKSFQMSGEQENDLRMWLGTGMTSPISAVVSSGKQEEDEEPLELIADMKTRTPTHQKAWCPRAENQKRAAKETTDCMDPQTANRKLSDQLIKLNSPK